MPLFRLCEGWCIPLELFQGAIVSSRWDESLLLPPFLSIDLKVLLLRIEFATFRNRRISCW